MVIVPTRHRTAPELDAATLEACRRGDREALGRVLRERAPMLARLITRLCGPAADVEDLLQITMIAAVRALPRFRGEATLDTWLQRIAINAVRSHVRRERPASRVSLEVLRDASDAPDPRPSAERVVDDRRRLERLHHHLAAIGADKRVAYLLHVVEGLAVEEIAALMGAGRFATKSRIYWAGRALRARAKQDPLLRDLLAEKEDAP
jgi:RNA polymerase sigma-70 factor (ECF subfamily)